MDTSLREYLLKLGLKNRTARVYVSEVRRAQAFVEARGRTLARATFADLEAFARTRPHTRSTTQLMRSSLGHFYACIGRREPPLHAIPRMKKPTYDCRALDEEDAMLLEKAARARGDRMGLAVLVGLYMGLRCEEIAGLRWDSIGADQWAEIVGKGDKTRWVFVHPVLGDELEQRTPASPWVFPGQKKGRSVVPATIWGWVRRVGASVALYGLKPHELRHTNLAEMLDRTGDLRATQDHAGHARPETTALYTRATRRRKRAAVLAIRYDGVRVDA